MDSVAVEASCRESPSPENEAQEKYQCPRCSSSFKRPEHLKRHQRSHDGHKPFMCSICLKRFFRSDILTRHELMHLATQRTHTTVPRKRACMECARARERCSRDEPCMRCSTKSIQCLYPDDGSQKNQSLGDESLESTTNEPGQFEEHPRLTSHHPSILPKQEGFMTSNPLHRSSFNEDDTPLCDFLHSLRSPNSTTPSYLPDTDRSSNLLYKNNGFLSEGHPNIAPPLGSIGGEARGFEPKTLDAGRQAPLFDQPPGPSYNRSSIHDLISLDEHHYGQPLGDYNNLIADPSSSSSAAAAAFDFHSSSELQASRGAQDPFLSAHAEQPQAAGTFTDSDGAAAPRGLLTLADFGSRPINLKAYELIASNFKQLCLEHGDGASLACSNNISESQRTAQHELFVKLYYEHFKQQAY
ncbi:hypothetical protein F4804DRAFT_153290 [Jackrogersella minutella]|nr:hypothetical protein F4804DRAFT_153290 [Jackrogersella minutella]